MASRTNKMWILKKKKQLQKQQKSTKATREELENVKRDYTNPKGNTYTRFFRSGKLICDSTTAREDPDGYRIVWKPNSGDYDFVYKGFDSWGYRKWLRKHKKLKAK